MLVASVLRRAGYDVEECGNGLLLLMKFGSFLDLGLVGDWHSFVAAPGAERCDLIISDIRLPGATGLDVLERTRRRRHYPPVILMTAFGDEDTHAQAHRLGAAAVFDKPFEMDELLTEVRAILPA